MSLEWWFQQNIEAAWGLPAIRRLVRSETEVVAVRPTTRRRHISTEAIPGICDTRCIGDRIVAEVSIKGESSSSAPDRLTRGETTHSCSVNTPSSLPDTPSSLPAFIPTALTAELHFDCTCFDSLLTASQLGGVSGSDNVRLGIPFRARASKLVRRLYSSGTVA